MPIHKLTEEISVAPQISAANVSEIAAAGFRTIVCNRPDGEEFGQPECSQIEQAAASHGLAFVTQPVISGQMTAEDVARFRELLDSVEKPVLAYCRTGTRCTILWAFAEASSERSIDEIVSAAQAAGYDISGMAPALTAMRSNSG